MKWTADTPTMSGFYWAECPKGVVTIVHYHDPSGIFTEIGSTMEALNPSPWLRFSDQPLPLPTPRTSA